MRTILLCACGHEVALHGGTGRCLMQTVDASDCSCREPRPEKVVQGEAVFRVVPWSDPRDEGVR